MEDRFGSMVLINAARRGDPFYWGFWRPVLVVIFSSGGNIPDLSALGAFQSSLCPVTFRTGLPRKFCRETQDMADPLRPEPPLGASRAGGFAHNQGMIQAIKQKLTWFKQSLTRSFK
jgi:hypothetical protein